MLEMNKKVIVFVRVNVRINNMANKTNKNDQLDDETQAYLEFYFQPLEEEDDVDDLIEEEEDD